MYPYTKEKVSKVMAKTGHSLCLDDLPDIIELDRIAEEIHGAAKLASASSDLFQLGGRTFTKPTFARADFIERLQARYILPAFVLTGIMYALDVEHDASDLRAIPSRRELMRYRASLDCTATDIAESIERLQNVPSDADADDSKQEADGFRICCIIAREIGGSPEEWMDASESKLGAALRTIDEKIQAEISANKGRKATPPAPTPKLYAVKRFADKLKALELKWLAT